MSWATGNCDAASLNGLGGQLKENATQPQASLVLLGQNERPSPSGSTADAAQQLSHVQPQQQRQHQQPQDPKTAAEMQAVRPCLSGAAPGDEGPTLSGEPPRAVDSEYLRPTGSAPLLLVPPAAPAEASCRVATPPSVLPPVSFAVPGGAGSTMSLGGRSVGLGRTDFGRPQLPPLTALTARPTIGQAPLTAGSAVTGFSSLPSSRRGSMFSTFSTSTHDSAFMTDGDGTVPASGAVSGAPSKRSGRHNVSDEDLRAKNERRLLQCRVSAKLSRERKKQFISTLESQLQQLQQTKTELEAVVALLLCENERLRQARGIASGQPVLPTQSNSEPMAAVQLSVSSTASAPGVLPSLPMDLSAAAAPPPGSASGLALQPAVGTALSAPIMQAELASLLDWVRRPGAVTQTAQAAQGLGTAYSLSPPDQQSASAHLMHTAQQEMAAFDDRSLVQADQPGLTGTEQGQQAAAFPAELSGGGGVLADMTLVDSML